MARSYEVKGTRDFLIWSVVLFGLGIWAVRDGWFPPPSKLEKYPPRVAMHFEVSGVVSEVAVEPGQEVKTGTVLARLQDEAARRRVEQAEAELAEADPEDRETLVRLRRSLEAEQARLAQHSLPSSSDGVLVDVYISPRDEVTPEDEAFTVDPRHHFYPFNKSLAVFSLLGAVVCLVIHFKVR